MLQKYLQTIKIHNFSNSWETNLIVEVIDSDLQPDKKIDMIKNLIAIGDNIDIRRTDLDWNIIH